MTHLSDQRYKEEIKPITDSSELLKLKPMSYKMKGGTKLQFGFIAQDIEETNLANIVYQNGQGIRSVAYNQLIALLVHQVQELTERVAHLEAKLK